jgi:two-component system response regulator PilR (NtrC family)
VILARFAKQGHDAVLSQQALEALRDYPFPGNVRELENILERALAFASDGVIEVADLALKSGQPRHDGSGFLSEKTESEPCAPSVSSPFLQKNIPEFVLAGEERNSLPDYLDRVERDIIVRALEKTRYNRTKAAQLLGISFRQLRYQMQKLAICEPE